MTIERARVEAVSKPWGVDGVTPWTAAQGRIGEVWFERADADAEAPVLQLKLLFTSQPLSIQVHPNDAQAIEAGFTRGKTEAWYVLAADAAAKVGVGLTRTCSVRDVRIAADNGAIAALVDWHGVAAGDVVNVPAGTIHAIGAGIVIAEIQQRSDITYRLYDYGRDRPLQVESALAVSVPGPLQSRARSGRISDQRHLLSATPYFCFEKIVLAPASRWAFETPCETWLLTLQGNADACGTALVQGDALYIDADHGDIHAGAAGATFLVAYAQPSVLPYMLQRAAQGRPGASSPPSGHSLLGRALQGAAQTAAAREAGLL